MGKSSSPTSNLKAFVVPLTVITKENNDLTQPISLSDWNEIQKNTKLGQFYIARKLSSVSEQKMAFQNYLMPKKSFLIKGRINSILTLCSQQE
ncbi:MAG: hypothetical protein R3A45_12260 [Bdellovibrionota bacterium]